MTWVRMDDSWPFNRKLLGVEPCERLMWCMSIAYCSSQNTDGRIDWHMARMLGFLAGADDLEQSIDRLVGARLWDADGDGWMVHDYLDFNFTAAERRDLSEQRSAAGRRGGASRASTGQASAQASGQANAKQVLEHLPSNGQATRQRVAKQSSSNVPSRPVPSKKTPSSSSASSSSDDDDVVSQTLIELGRRDHERAIRDGVDIRNRKAHLAACVDKRQADRRTVAALVAANPEWPPERVADEHDDPGGADKRAGRDRALQAMET